jgi:LAGLIDADG endonuclease
MDDQAFWAYLAGFTDGDGCISRETSKGSYHYSRIRWSQKESESAVLDEIAEFLGRQGIKLTQRNFSVSHAGHKFPQRELGVTNAADTRLVLHQLLPYLIIKRERAEEALVVLDHVYELKQRLGNKYRISTGGCAYPDCTRPFYAKSLCQYHYDKKRRGSLPAKVSSSSIEVIHGEPGQVG